MAPPRTPNEARGTIHAASARNLAAVTVRAVPVPTPILEFLIANASVLRTLQSELAVDEPEDVEEARVTSDDVFGQATVRPEQFWEALGEKCAEVGGEWVGVADKIWTFGPQRVGSCLLIDNRSSAPATS